MRILGVRHHSPACAALVRDVVREVRPARVLIEGPVDFNDRLGELSLGHRLPIAIFSYRRPDAEGNVPVSCPGGCRATWTPFCDYSPEWVALTTAREIGAQALFMDLPSWSLAFEHRENRYGDRQSPGLAELSVRLGFDDSDRMWDSLFEQPRADLEDALNLYFQELREACGEVQPGDVSRESFMASCLAWAQAQTEGPVVAVCGGYHAPFLKAAWSTASPVPPRWDSGAEAGSFLVPFSFQRLDSFAGYQSGMPCPEYHQKVWEGGLDRAASESLREVVERLRHKRQALSSADLVVATTMAQGLARLRGHRHVSRTDLLDGLASAFLSDALEAPLPWSQRGTLPTGSDPILVEIVAAFSGHRRGVLHPDTARPPLVEEVNGTLVRLGLMPGPREARIRLNCAQNRESSACLHRLSILGIPGFRRLEGSSLVTRGGLQELWSISDSLDRDPALIEASHYGPDLASACSGFLEQALCDSESSATVADLLSQALFADLEALSLRALDAIAQAMAREHLLGPLGQALTVILEIFSHDRLLGGRGRDECRQALEAGFVRGLWLCEGQRSEELGVLEAMAALRDVHRHADLDLPREMALGLMGRSMSEPGRSRSLQGAALGYLWSVQAEGPDWGSQAEDQFRRLPATEAADFLVGLLVLARESVTDDEQLLRGLDARLREWTEHEFLQALPALRLAFLALPPMDKDRLGRQLAALYGASVTPGWLKLDLDPAEVARGMDLEERLDQALRERKLL